MKKAPMDQDSSSAAATSNPIGSGRDKIERDPSGAEKKTYDLIIIGGGIYGVMLALEASQRNLSSLLLEKDDFGGATTYNHLRIIHGGLRYLQSLDLVRYFESVRERNWFLRHFPALIRPLPCLMPLYGEGIRRPAIFRAALAMNEILSLSRNNSIRPDLHLASGRVIDAPATVALFPDVDRNSLKGGALWYDACAPDSPRLVMELVRWASGHNTALNHMRCDGVSITANRIEGVTATDTETDKFHRFQGKVVVNAAGPWCRDIAAKFQVEETSLFPRKILAWNILFKRPALSSHALALTPKQPKARTYFLHPWKGRLLAGTGETPWESGATPYPGTTHIRSFLNDLNKAVPGLKLEESEIERVYPGIMPANPNGKLMSREIIFSHAQAGGPEGLYSVSGVKFTTARLVAEKTLRRIFPDAGVTLPQAPRESESARGLFDLDSLETISDSQPVEKWTEKLAALAKDESALHLDDLLLRRTNIGDRAELALNIAPSLCTSFGWDEARSRKELEALARALAVGNGAGQLPAVA